MIRGGSRTAAASKMELFVIIVNGFQPLTIITNCSILDAAAVRSPLMVIFVSNDYQLGSLSLIVYISSVGYTKNIIESLTCLDTRDKQFIIGTPRQHFSAFNKRKIDCLRY